MKVEVSVLGSLSIIYLIVSADVKQHWTWIKRHTHIYIYIICISSSGAVWKLRWSPSNSPYGLCRHETKLNLNKKNIRAQELSESRGGHPGLPVPHNSYGFRGHKTTLNLNFNYYSFYIRAQELCESRGGHPGIPVPSSPYGLCGCKATVNLNFFKYKKNIRA